MLVMAVITNNTFFFHNIDFWFEILSKIAKIYPAYHTGDNGITSGKHVRVKYTPLKPQGFYIAKLGYAGVYLFFLFLLQNIDCGCSLEPPRRGGSNVYPQSMF